MERNKERREYTGYKVTSKINGIEYFIGEGQQKDGEVVYDFK